jgi:ubiquinone/menaquinone biosynthesis C-methylase UbiE
VGHHLDLAALQPGEKVLDLGSGSGTDVFCAAVLVGASGHVVGVDITDEQLDKAARLRDRAGFSQVELVEAHIEELPSRTRASTRSYPTASSISHREKTGSSRRRRASCGPAGDWRSPTLSAAER